MISKNIPLLPASTITTGATAVNGLFQRTAAMFSLTLQANFVYGSGGTTCKVFLQSSLDAGTTWYDVACFSFTTASARKIMTIKSGSTGTLSAYTATDGTLANDTAKDGMLGDRLRVKIISTGTYAGGTTVDLQAVVN